MSSIATSASRGVLLPPLSLSISFFVAKTACVRRRWQLLVLVALFLLLFIAGFILLIVVGMSIAILGACHD